MPSLKCFLCFGRKPQIIESSPITYKEPASSTQSVSSLDEKYPAKEAAVLVPEPKSLPKFNRALAVVSKKEYAILESLPFPTLNHQKEVIISTRAVGLNPIDWKSVDFNFCLPEFPWVTGREMAGVVEQVGSEVKNFKVGQRVWTSTYYRDCRAGCFQQYVTVPEHTVSHIPSELSFEEASCLGVAGLTAAMALWKWLQVPGSPAVETLTLPESGYLLIWGGATITAQFAIQIAVLGGLKVIAVTSEKTRSRAEALGAAHVVTRDGKTAEQIIADIRAIGGDDITRGIDLVGTQTASHCLEALSRTKKTLFAPLAMISSKAVVPQNISVETVEMKRFVLDEDSYVYSHALNELVAQKKVVLPDIEVIPGGLDIIVDGLDRIKRGELAGKRVVVTM